MLNQVLNETLQSGVTDTMDKHYIWNTQCYAAGGGTPVGQSGIQSFREEMAQKMDYNQWDNNQHHNHNGLEYRLVCLR